MAKFKSTRQPFKKEKKSSNKVELEKNVMPLNGVKKHVKKSNKSNKSTQKLSEIEKLSAKILSHKNKNKAVELVAKPVRIDQREFKNLSVYEEVDALNILGVDEKSGAAFIEDWGKNFQDKSHRVLEDVKLVRPPKKQKFSMKKVSEEQEDEDDDVEGSISSDDSEGEVEEENNLKDADASKKKKKKKKAPTVKATYDKPSVMNGNKCNAKSTGVPEGKTDTSTDGPSADVSGWDNLGIPEPLLEVISKLGFTNPTKIQSLSIPPAIRGGRDILGAAETGSGKTLAFGIPIVAGLRRDRLRRQEKMRQREVLSKLSAETQEKKRKRTQALDSDEEREIGGNSDEDDVDDQEESDNGESDSNDESDAEEYLFNGPDGIMEVDYSALDKERRQQHSKKKDLQKSKALKAETTSSSDENESADSDEADESDDSEANEEDQESEMSKMKTLDNSDSDDGLEIDSDAEQPYESDDYPEPKRGRKVKFTSHKSSQSAESEDAKKEQGSSDDDSDENDLGSDDEEDIEYDENDDGENMKCVYAVNNVKFPFEELHKPKYMETGDEQLVRALILTPTRELAVQIHQHLSPLCKAVGVTSSVVVGGFDSYKQKRVLRRMRPELVVATPGRLWELIQEGVDHLKELRGIRYLAIDEADRMVDRKNFEEVHKIVHTMGDGLGKNKASSNRQTFVFSATLTLVHQLPDRVQLKKNAKRNTNKSGAVTSEEKLQQLAKMVGMKPSAKIFDVTRKHATAEKLTECRINCEREEKDHYLYYFLVQHPGRTMVFCNSIEATRRLKSLFSLLKCNAQDLHASMHQKQRLRNLEQFSRSERSVLITTDVAARGLDISGVQHVVHYQVPFTAESYVHRSGRTARASSSGLSLVFVEPKDVLRFRQICRTLGRADVNDIPLFAVNEDLLEQVHERVNLATSLEKLLHQIRRDEEDDADKGEMHDAGLQPSDDEMDQEDLYLLPAAQQRLIRSGGRKGEVKVLQKQLNESLKAPLVGSMFSFRNPTTRTALAAGLGAESASIPANLIGITPTDNFTEASQLDYMERYASELYGDALSSAHKSKSSLLLKQHRKDMAKLTKKLLKPEQSIKELKTRKKEKIIEKNKKKLEKKREKRKKNRMQKKISK
ncbi:Helicase C-terminal [Trinorchestia longiramus]|nr:Helicase C-terminal [Trinorchestia longiramus]